MKEATMQAIDEGSGSHAKPQGDLLSLRVQFAESLGLQEPVSEEVLKAALQDETYAHNLRVSSRTPVMLQVLLMNPPQPRPSAPELTTAELAGQVAHSLLRWAKTGFSVVDEATLQRRKTACAGCPNLSAPPDRAIYKLVLSDDQICNLCGCKVSLKTRLPSEACPDLHPELPGMTRWGEPVTG
jgi:hypothetical protein